MAEFADKPPQNHSSKVCSRDNMDACAAALAKIEDGSETWEELTLIKSMAPRASCIIPASSHDFVSSSLLAVGACALLIDGIVYKCVFSI